MRTMKTIPASKARERLFPLIREAKSSGPVQIASRDGSVVLIDAEEWNAWMETFYVMSQPGIMRAIRESVGVPRHKLKQYEEIT